MLAGQVQLNAVGQDWHNGCFKCEGCGGVLSVSLWFVVFVPSSYFYECFKGTFVNRGGMKDVVSMFLFLTSLFYIKKKGNHSIRNANKNKVFDIKFLKLLFRQWIATIEPC